MKVIGIRPSSFTGTDGKAVSGINIYATYKLDKGDGYGCERMFVTDEKVHGWGYVPMVGDEIAVAYNRYGKVSDITKQ